MKKSGNILWGLVLIAVGVIFALNAFDITDINIFFDGWWTLFIIVPCLIGLINGKEITGNLITIAVGVFLLLCCQGVLDFNILWKLAIPAAIILVGIKMIFSGMFNKKSDEAMKKIRTSGGHIKTGTAVFCGTSINCQGEDFYGANLTAVFGGIDFDARKAVIKQDCVIKAWVIFGGIDILVPENVNVKINSVPIFGGVSDKHNTRADGNSHTLYINAVCLFGGLDVK